MHNEGSCRASYWYRTGWFTATLICLQYRSIAVSSTENCCLWSYSSKKFSSTLFWQVFKLWTAALKWKIYSTDKCLQELICYRSQILCTDKMNWTKCQKARQKDDQCTLHDDILIENGPLQLVDCNIRFGCWWATWLRWLLLAGLPILIHWISWDPVL